MDGWWLADACGCDGISETRSGQGRRHREGIIHYGSGVGREGEVPTTLQGGVIHTPMMISGRVCRHRKGGIGSGVGEVSKNLQGGVIHRKGRIGSGVGGEREVSTILQGSVIHFGSHQPHVLGELAIQTTRWWWLSVQLQETGIVQSGL